MVMNSFCYEGVLFDFGRGEEAFAGTTRLFSFGGGVPRPELEPPLVAGRVTASIVELAKLWGTFAHGTQCAAREYCDCGACVWGEVSRDDEDIGSSTIEGGANKIIRPLHCTRHDVHETFSVLRVYVNFTPELSVDLVS